MKVVVLSGGGGGARFLRGVVDVAEPANVTAVVNGDVPCVVPQDIRALDAATPDAGLAYVAARDGTTNALGLSHPRLFTPLYGDGSAERFRRHAEANGIDVAQAAIPNLAADVDALEDLERIQLRVGPRTLAVFTAR